MSLGEMIVPLSSKLLLSKVDVYVHFWALLCACLTISHQYLTCLNHRSFTVRQRSRAHCQQLYWHSVITSSRSSRIHMNFTNSLICSRQSRTRPSPGLGLVVAGQLLRHAVPPAGPTQELLLLFLGVVLALRPSLSLLLTFLDPHTETEPFASPMEFPGWGESSHSPPSMIIGITVPRIF